MPTLTALIEQKQHLETQLEDVLTYTEELEQIWENTELAIAHKVDAYGFVIDDLKNKIEFLADKKRKVTEIKQKLENEIERIKYRLNAHCNGEKLIGNEYKMHPFNSVTNTVNMELVEDEYKSYTLPKLSHVEYWILKDDIKMDIQSASENDDRDALELLHRVYAKILAATESCNVSDLPKEHKALVSNIKPSVRIT